MRARSFLADREAQLLGAGAGDVERDRQGALANPAIPRCLVVERERDVKNLLHFVELGFGRQRVSRHGSLRVESSADEAHATGSARSPPHREARADALFARLRNPNIQPGATDATRAE